jgi:hypothetical protein
MARRNSSADGWTGPGESVSQETDDVRDRLPGPNDSEAPNRTSPVRRDDPEAAYRSTLGTAEAAT